VNPSRDHRIVSLYTGAGGLDLGLETAGFRPALCVELDGDARQTLAKNRPRWLLSDPGNIHSLRPEDLLEQASLKPRQAALLVGGPPCQPFSKSSYWTNGDARRLADPRSHTLRAFVDAVRVILPRVLILENVQGLTYRGKDEGLRLLVDGLKTINDIYRTAYRPQVISLNAADYGVPEVIART
jgi:DNA (cytosine-5)-methyltransferase 1